MHYQSTIDRFWSKVDKSGACWLWKASISSTGYGKFTINGVKIYAHRFAYELVNELLPDYAQRGLELDHLCRNRSCVRPQHLELVTKRENILRGTGFAAREAMKTQCPKGHPYDLFNTYITTAGTRACRACQREHSRIYEQRKRGVRLASS